MRKLYLLQILPDKVRHAKNRLAIVRQEKAGKYLAMNRINFGST